MATKRIHPSIDELLHQDHYEADELADLLDMDVKLIRHAAFSGELRAAIINHHILSIRREDVLDWLKNRQ
ncbi:MAG TPA: hypothetical protein VGR16_09570 [Thermomicrobiales bacterium]|nr:hypothetical protein [Thermomicrobiales bacterium]